MIAYGLLVLFAAVAAPAPGAASAVPAGTETLRQLEQAFAQLRRIGAPEPGVSAAGPQDPS